MNESNLKCTNCGAQTYQYPESIRYCEPYGLPMYYYQCPACGHGFVSSKYGLGPIVYTANDWYDIKKEYKNMEPKTKVQRHKELCDSLNDLYARKNADYGDSFHISYEQEGMAMPRIRLGDKYNRFCALTRGKEQKVNDESLRDTLIDLANYALMTVLELDAESGQT